MPLEKPFSGFTSENRFAGALTEPSETPFLFETVRLHIYHAMDSVNRWDCPAFKLADGVSHTPEEIQANPKLPLKEPDTLFVIDGSRWESYFVLAKPGESVGQYSPA